MRIQADDAPAHLGQLLQRAGQIGGPHHGDHVRCAGGRLGQGAGEGRGVPVLDHHPAGPEGGGRAQDGADVLGIGDLVQHQDHALGRPGDVLDIGALGGGGEEGEALMHRARRQQAVDLPRLHDLGLGTAFALERPAGGQDHAGQLFAARIGQGGLHRMAAPEPFQAPFGTRRVAATKAARMSPFAVVASVGSGHYKTRSRFGADVVSTSWQPSRPDGSGRRKSWVQARRARRGNVPSGKGGGL